MQEEYINKNNMFYKNTNMMCIKTQTYLIKVQIYCKYKITNIQNKDTNMLDKSTCEYKYTNMLNKNASICDKKANTINRNSNI